jgi:hypothetical protein
VDGMRRRRDRVVNDEKPFHGTLRSGLC